MIDLLLRALDVALPAILALGGMGMLSALVLYIVSRRFETPDDPRLAAVQDLLPAANCGGCGYPGCSGFAAACVRADSLDGLLCPVGGQETMNRIAVALGRNAVVCEPAVAIVCCQGSCAHRPYTNTYKGTERCAVAAALYGGETACSYGCLGWGDCREACAFGALRIDPATRLPVVDTTRCTACGACIKACPKGLMALRPKEARVYVACRNRDKGAAARKACSVACIGCAKCQKTCESGAITVEGNLASINDALCTRCGRCVAACPTAAIVEYLTTPTL